jgi:galactose oxidase
MNVKVALLKYYPQIVLFFVLCEVFYLLASRPTIFPTAISKWPVDHENEGRWGDSISIPLVAVAVAVLPATGHVLVWSSDKPDAFGKRNYTSTAIYDPQTGLVSTLINSTTHHNMFCPGLSIDSRGRPVVAGGSTNAYTSIYESEHNTWVAGAEMTTGRGYQSQATTSDGRIFTIGGSWSGGLGGKDGEIFDPERNAWSKLPGCKVEPMLTKDSLGVFAADNHAWLFGWKDGTVFQAGPSSTMNWYGTRGNGTHRASVTRGQDIDSMNGNAIMYDATNGKILTLGGAHSYSSASSTSAAHIITLSNPFEAPGVEEIRQMHYPRVYGNSVVLPTGDVFVNGGASYAMQWTDVNAIMVPELWNPKTKRFTRMARNTVPRTYHSVAVLLPDATVLTGGGGVCWEDCEKERVLGDGYNHYDIQIFEPPYLFNGNAKSLAIRPRIKDVSQTVVKLGATLNVSVDMETAEFAIIRYGSATHSINTDQRRISLEPTPIGTSTKDSRYRNLRYTRQQDTGRLWTYQITIPADPGLVIPGYWMLFALNTHGTPSISKKICL